VKILKSEPSEILGNQPVQEPEDFRAELRRARSGELPDLEDWPQATVLSAEFPQANFSIPPATVFAESWTVSSVAEHGSGWGTNSRSAAILENPIRAMTPFHVSPPEMLSRNSAPQFSWTHHPVALKDCCRS